MANIGEQLLQPEEGWKRIDDSDPKIIYTGSWELSPSTLNYNSTGHYISTSASGGIAKFKFYGTKLRLIGISNNKYTKNGKILIDSTEYSFSQYSDRPDASEGGTDQSLRKVLSFEIKDLSSNCHTVKIIAEQSERIFIDAIDIDEDGYMVASVGCPLSQPETGWTRIDDTNPKITYNGNWTNDNLVLEGIYYYNHTISYTNNKDDSLDFYFYGNKLRIIDSVTPNRSQITKIFIDGIEYQYSTYNETKILKPILVFEIDGLRNGAHKVTISNTDDLFIGLDAIDIDGRILSLEEYNALLNKHLIKSNDKYYTIENDELVEITEPITQDLIKDRGVSASALTENQSLLPDKFKLISYKNNTFNIKATKSHKELVVASSDFSTTVQSNIDFFDVVGITDSGTSIKVAFSIDGGATWKTYDTEFKDLSVIIPLKPYNELTEEELNQWNNAKDIISEQGIDIANLSKIDFNTLNMKKIRFAYVLSINSKDNKCCTSQLKWQFDSKGTMKSMTSDELEIELLQDSIKIVPKVSSDMIKINFTNGVNVNVEGLSVSHKVLFDGKADTGLASYELADNINNYDFVSITSMTSDDGTTKNITLPVSILDKAMSKTQPISLESYYAPTNGAHMYVIRFRLQNNTLFITDIQYKGWSDCYICSVIGIKCSKESSNLDINSLTDEQISTLKVRLGI